MPDIYLCKHRTEDGLKLDQFAILAFITPCDETGTLYWVCKYMKYGHVAMALRVMDRELIDLYYRPITAEELEQLKSKYYFQKGVDRFT